MGEGQGWLESDEDYEKRSIRESAEEKLRSFTNDAPSQGFFETDDSYISRIQEEARSKEYEHLTGEAPSQGFFESDTDFQRRLSDSIEERSFEAHGGSAPSQRFFEGDAEFRARRRRELDELTVTDLSGQVPKQRFFESNEEFHRRLKDEARAAKRADFSPPPTRGWFESESSFQGRLFAWRGGSGDPDEILDPLESNAAYRIRKSHELNLEFLERSQGHVPERWTHESDAQFRHRVKERVCEEAIRNHRGQIPRRLTGESTVEYLNRIEFEAEIAALSTLDGSQPSQKFYESEAAFKARVRRKLRDLAGATKVHDASTALVHGLSLGDPCVAGTASPATHTTSRVVSKSSGGTLLRIVGIGLGILAAWFFVMILVFIFNWMIVRPFSLPSTQAPKADPPPSRVNMRRELHPGWFGSWRAVDNGDRLEITAKSLRFLPGPKGVEGPSSEEVKYTWTARFSEEISKAKDWRPNEFGYERALLSPEKVLGEFEEAWASHMKSPNPYYAVSDAGASRAAIKSIRPGKYRVMWRYDGGSDCGYFQYLVDGASILEISDHHYGFLVRKYVRESSMELRKGEP